MKYDLSNPRDVGEALTYFNNLAQEKKKVEIKVIKPRRSLPQNSYLHLLLGYFGSHFGYTIEEAKELYKRLPGNKEIYAYTKDVGGRSMEFLRSSADLTKEDFTKTIETLREWSGKLGFPLPPVTDQEWLDRIDNEIERNERYL